MMLPLLMPTVFFLLVVNLVYAAFDTFGTIQALTGGGPGKATETLVVKVYRDGVVESRYRFVVGAVGGADARRDRADRACSSAFWAAGGRVSERPAMPDASTGRRIWCCAWRGCCSCCRSGWCWPARRSGCRGDRARRAVADPAPARAGDLCKRADRRRDRDGAGLAHAAGVARHGAGDRRAARSSFRCCRPMRSRSSAFRSA